MKLKLKEKLKELVIANKTYRYEVKVSNDDFKILQKYKINNIRKENDIIIFNCDTFSFYKIKKEKVTLEIKDNLKFYINNNKHKLVISFLMVLIVLILFFINQLFIREITFNDARYKNQDIYQEVESYTVKVGPYLFLKDSISDISKKLRQEFYEYAYVGLSKKGSKLVIDVSYQDVPNVNEENEQRIGEYYSTSDATIYYINITSGQVLINYNDVVKAGDLLATSNLQHQNNLYSSDLMVPLNGYIIGLVKEYYEIEVLKKEEIEIYSGNIKQSYEISYNDKTIYNKENQFLISFTTRTELLKIGNLKINKITNYEKKTEIVVRNKEEAIDYAKTIMYQDYEKNYISDKEKIVSINLLKIEEFEDYFLLKFFVSVRKNIVLFKKL